MTKVRTSVKLNEYFERAKGVGVLATADTGGKVNTAIYARPHFLDPDDENTIAFIMGDRLSHTNIQANPHASYLFMEAGEGHIGKRLSLTRIKEETDAKKIQAIRRRKLPAECEKGKTRFLVTFRIDGVRPLMGNK
jgi:hypothetical protein